MKRILILLLSVLLLCMLAGCECKHEWRAATCLEPQTCEKCGATEGAARGHRYSPATCVKPTTCWDCPYSEEKLLPHVWADADCEYPQICKLCKQTQGEPLGHELVLADLEDSTVIWGCTRCNYQKDELTLDPASIAPEFLQGQWFAQELYMGNAQEWKNVQDYGLSFFVVDGKVTSMLPDNEGSGDVVFASADSTAIRFEVEINDEFYDIVLYKDRPGEMYWYFRDYYSVFKCVKK